MSRARIGLAGSALAAGGVLAALLAPALLRRVALGTLLRAALVGLAVGTLVLVGGREPASVIAAALLLGAAGTLVIVAVPLVIEASQGPARAAALAEANFGASAAGVLAPVAIGGATLLGVGWEAGAVLVLLPIGLLALTLRRPVATGRALEVDDPAPAGALTGGYWRWWSLIVLVVGVEFCIAFWASDFLREETGLDRGAASIALGGFVGGMAAGRFVGGRLAATLDPRRLLLGSLGVALAGFSLFWSATVPAPAVAGLVVAGTGVALLYPLSLALAMGAAPGRAQAASARASLGSGLAVLVAPFALAALADQVGVRSAFAIVFGLIGAGIGVASWRRRSGGGASRPQQ